jgi:outer membrane receptor protein involved in Fe transport
MRISSRTILVCGTALAGLVLPAVAIAQTPATAQETPTAEAAPADAGEILVTGSRIKRDGFSSPVPVTVVDASLIKNLAQTNAADVIRLMPQNIASQSDATSGTSLSANAGSQFANLRGLNPTFGTRTLTLVNTRRFIPTSDGGQVDLNLIPSVLIGRVETVTGGASAAYGSDAIAGVVNIILDNTFTGVKAQIDYGQTGRGDGKSLHGAAAYGLNFAEGRGHIMVGGEYQRNRGIGQCYDVREWCREGWGVVLNQGAIRPNYNRNDRTTLNQNQAGRASATLNTAGYNVPGSVGAGLPNYVLGRDLGLVYNSTYGAIRNFYQAGSTTGTVYSAIFPEVNPPTALIDKVFSPDGQSISDFDPGLFGPKLVGAVALGGDNDSAYHDQLIQTPVKRYSTYLAAEFELSSALKVSTELSYADRKAKSRAITAATRSTMSIRADNAFLPASVAAIMNAPQAAGSSPYPIAPYTFSLGKDPDDQLDNDISVDAKAFRGVLAFSGKLFGDWTWDAYYQYGKNKRFSSVKYSRQNDAFFMAIDAVRQTPGNAASPIICRPLNEATISSNLAAGRFTTAYVAQLRALNAACKPLNLFGNQNLTTDAVNFAWQPAVEDFKFREHVLSGSVQGTLLQGWAGPISLAGGIDYRDDKGDVTHGGVNPNDYAFSFGLDYGGKIQVVEGFVETNVPVFKDFFLGDSFELNGAVRYSRNKSTDTLANASRSIKATSWKVGGIYDVFEGLRFRATQSRDIRAAGFRELFQKTAPTESGTAQGRVNNFNRIDPSKGGVAGADPADATPIFTGGNFTLAPEKADTTTGGIVITPTFLRGFRASLDWYQIKLKQAIANLTGQRVTDLCHDAGLLCDRVVFASPLDITRVNAGSANVGLITTRGYDFEASYRLPLADVSNGLPGAFDLRFLLNHQYAFVVQQGPGAVKVNYAGQSGPVVEGGDFYPSPKWMWNALLGYTVDHFNGTVTVRHVGKGKLNATLIGPEDPGYSPTLANSITTNRVKGATYVNLSMSYGIQIGAGKDDVVEIFGSVDNLLDKKPPVAPGTAVISSNAYPTNPVYFDTFGMRWRGGMRVRF